ncbi:two-component system sensor histidine kinase NtrB [Harenicola maris]
MTDRVWQTLPIPAIILDANDRFAEVNSAAEMFLNLSSRATLNHPVWDVLMVDAPLEQGLERVRESESPLFINDVDVGTGERAPVPCNLQIAPMQDDSTQLLMLIAPREIAGRLGRSISVQSTARSAIGMAEMLAHEIKNPLAGIAGAAQLLSMSLSGDDLELTDLIVGETRRVVKLLEQVEQFGNVRPPNLSPVNIHDILERARKSAQLGFGAHMTMTESYDPSLPQTVGDADQLLQVFLNLLKNAAEAAGDTPGTIHLRTFYDTSLRIRRPGGHGGAPVPLQVEITDNGPGLPPDIAEAAFEPFVSGRENGTGLGLALVSKIIGEHGGWVTVKSVPGRTVFRISLPVARSGATGSPQKSKEA